MTTVYRDAQRVLLSLLAGPLALVGLALFVAAAVGYCAATATCKDCLQVAALTDTVRLTDSIYLAQTDTIVRIQRRVDTLRLAADTLDLSVHVIDDSTVALPDTVAIIPPLVVADLTALRLTVAAQDTLIRALYGRDTTQQWRIATRDKRYAAELRKANAPRWGYGVTLGYGCSDKGCGPTLAAGLSYQAGFPRVLRAIVRRIAR